jgi:hypothetical protein
MRLVVPPRLDIREVASTRARWLSTLAATPGAATVEIDLDGAEVDGAGLQLLVSLSAGLLGRGSALRLIGATPELDDQLQGWRSRLAGQARG